MNEITTLSSTPVSEEGYAEDGRRKWPVMVFGLLAAAVVALLVAPSSSYAQACPECQDANFAGNVAAWGYNSDGQLGNGTNTPSNKPVPVKNLTGISAVATGSAHSLALKNDGTVVTWGRNTEGQLGDGTNTDRTVAVNVKDPNGGALRGVKTIAAGSTHSLALKNDGTVVVWGVNSARLNPGGGTNNPGNTPVLVKNREGVVVKGIMGIAAGGSHSLALRDDTTVVAWGYNFYGQLGNGTNTASDTPVVVKTRNGSALKGVRALAGGGSHSLALKNDGTIVTWGLNSAGQLGNGTSGIDAGSNKPVPVKNLSGVRAIDAGSHHNLALKNDGTVVAWGTNAAGQLGNGTSGGISNTPLQVKNLSGARAIAAGSNHSLAALPPR